MLMCYVYLCTYLFNFIILFCVDGCFACIYVYYHVYDFKSKGVGSLFLDECVGLFCGI